MPRIPFGLILALLYGAVSLGIVFVNKIVLSRYGFGSYSNVLTFSQTVVTLLWLAFAKRMGWLHYADFNYDHAWALGPLSVIHVLNVSTGLGAAGYLTIPMLTVGRRLGTLFVIVLDQIVAGRSTSTDRLLAVSTMVAGAWVAAFYDLSFHVWGYFFVTVSNVSTALQLVLVRQIRVDEPQLNEFAILFYNNLLAVPVLIFLMTTTGEIVTVWHYPKLTHPVFVISFLTSCLLAGGLNYLLFCSSSVNSPLTTSVIGQVKGLLQIIAGLFAFGDVILEPLNILGLTISSIGSVAYAAIEYFDRQKPPQPPTDPTATASTTTTSPANGTTAVSPTSQPENSNSTATELVTISTASNGTPNGTTPHDAAVISIAAPSAEAISAANRPDPGGAGAIDTAPLLRTNR